MATPDKTRPDVETGIPVEGPDDRSKPAEAGHAIGRVVDDVATNLKYLPAMTQNLEMPRQGNCGFIAIPLTTLQELDTASEEKFHAEIMGLSRQKGTYNLSLQHGCLLIVNTAERPPEDLASIARSLRKIAPTARVIWGDGEVKHGNETDFSISHFPSPEAIQFVTEQESGTYSTVHLADTLNNPAKREGEHLKVRFSPTMHNEIVKVDKVKKLIAPGSNRPDKLIGYEEPLRAIREAIENPEIKVLIVEAPAGLGKTRLVNEALKGKQFTALANSASLKSRPGGNLARLAEQAHDALSEDALFSDGTDTTMPLAKFGKLTREEQIQEARKHSIGVTKQIVGALTTIHLGAERPILLIEDLHHTDLESEASVQTTLPFEFLQAFSAFNEADTDASGLVIITMRGNQMDKSPSYLRLLAEVKRTFGENTIDEVSLTDNPLDFTDPKIYEAFAFHGLNPLIRGAKEMSDPGAKKLGNWPEELGKVANALGNSPHVMTTLVDRLEEVAVITDEAVNIKPEDLAKITAIRSRDDLATVYEESFKRLTPNARTVLFSFALLGGKITQAQFHLIIESLEQAEGDETGLKNLETIEELEKAHYIRQVGENYELSHENLVDFVLQEAQNDTTLAQFLLKLQEIFAPHSGEVMHPDAQFTLFNNIAQNPKITSLGADFWQKYEEVVDSVLADAENLHDIQRGYSVGSSIMDRSKDTTERPNRIHQAVESMIADDPAAPENQARIAAKALKAIAKNAAYLGKFRESAEAANLLTKLTDSNPAIMNPREAALVSFRRAFMENKLKDMITSFEKLDKDTELPPCTKAIIEIQLAYRQKDYKKVRALYAANAGTFQEENKKHMAEHNGIPSPEVVNIYILATTRAPYEELREEISAGQDGLRVDDDVVYHPDILTEAQAAKLNIITNQRRKVQGLVDKYPDIIDPFNRIATFEVDANLSSHHPDLSQAIGYFQEAYRQAEKLGVHSQAARAAVLEAKRHVMAATREIGKGKINTQKLEDALAVFKQRAEMSLTLLDDETSPYHEQLHGERLRATGLYCYTLNKTITPQMPPAEKEKAENYVRDALNDCTALLKILGPEDAEETYLYYSYAEFVMQAANKLGIEVPAEIMESIKLEHTREGLQHSDTLTDHGVGDQTIKELGLFSLRRRIRAQRQK